MKIFNLRVENMKFSYQDKNIISVSVRIIPPKLNVFSKESHLCCANRYNVTEIMAGPFVRLPSSERKPYWNEKQEFTSTAQSNTSECNSVKFDWKYKEKLHTLWQSHLHHSCLKLLCFQ